MCSPGLVISHFRSVAVSVSLLRVYWCLKHFFCCALS